MQTRCNLSVVSSLDSEASISFSQYFSVHAYTWVCGIPPLQWITCRTAVPPPTAVSSKAMRSHLLGTTEDLPICGAGLGSLAFYWEEVGGPKNFSLALVTCEEFGEGTNLKSSCMWFFRCWG